MEYDFYLELYSDINSSMKYTLKNMKSNPNYFIKNYTKSEFLNKIYDMDLPTKDIKELKKIYRNTNFKF